MEPAGQRAANAVHALAGAVDKLRWAFLPLAMCGLVAVGAHAAADVLDDRFLALADQLDSLFDALASRWELTRPLVDLVDLEGRTWFARALALSFELWADLVLALPMLGYDERVDELGRLRELCARALARPTVLRLLRAPVALCLSIAGASAVARLVHGEVYVSLRGLLGSHGALFLARPAAVLALVLVLGSIAWRTSLRALEHADARSEPRTPRRVSAGAFGSLPLVPLALAAVLRASPLLSLLR